MQAPEKLTIDTPEQIALEFPLAGAGSRFLALAIDTVVQLAIVLVLALAALGVLWIRSLGYQAAATWAFALLILLGFLLYYGYFAAFEALWGGQTPGKRAVGLRVISITGQPITAFDALLRNLLRIVDQLPGVYAVGVLSIFFTARNQRVGDLVAGTVVVSEHRLPDVDLHAAPPTATRLGATRLTIEEVEIIQTFLARRADLPEPLRSRTASQLADRLRSRLELPAGSHRDDEALIEAIAAEWRRR